MQKEIQQFVGPDTYIVGHSIDSDLHALRLVHPRIIDTTQLYPHPKGYPFKHSLKNLCSTILGKEVQKGTGTSGHDSLADATHTMEVICICTSPIHALCSFRNTTSVPTALTVELAMIARDAFLSSI